jgi:hypothetical protein
MLRQATDINAVATPQEERCLGNSYGIAALAVMALVSSPATAPDEKNQSAGILGRTFISNEGIKGATFSNPFVRFGLTFEVNYSRYLITSPVFALSGEVSVVFNLDEDVNSGANVVPSDSSSYFITPAARVNPFPIHSPPQRFLLG